MDENKIELSEEERAALQEAASGEPSTEAPEERAARVRISEYNFRRPGQLSATQLRALNTIHEFFVKTIVGRTGNGPAIQLSRLSVDTVSYSSFVGSLSNPCFIVQLQSGTGETVLMDMDLPVARALSGALLGGLGDDEDADAPLTSVEQSIAGSWVEKTLPVLTEAWSMSFAVEFSLQTIETDPRFIQVMPDETPVVVMSFRLNCGSASGRFSICYPLESMQAMLEGLSLRMTGDQETAVDAAGNSEHLLKSLKKVPFDLYVELGRSTLLASQLIHMRVGDVLCLDRRVDEPLDIFFGDRRVLKARLGKQGDQLAVQVTGRCRHED